MIPQHIRAIAEELDCELPEDDADLDEIITWLTGIAIGKRTDELMALEEKYDPILEALRAGTEDDADPGNAGLDAQA